MKEADGSTTKLTVIYLNGTNMSLTKINPANGNELLELEELDSKGLTKFLVIDTSASFIAHKDIEKKLVDDLSGSNNVLSEIVNRSRDGHALVQIHASNIWLRKMKLTPSQYQELVRKEDKLLKK